MIGYTLLFFGIVAAACGGVIVLSTNNAPVVTPASKVWLNKGVYGAERIANWGHGEVWIWTGNSGNTYYIFRDGETGSIAAVHALNRDGTAVTWDKPTPQPSAIKPNTEDEGNPVISPREMEAKSDP
jgi:hypothetical protein